MPRGVKKAKSSRLLLDATVEVLHKHNGLWFNDECSVVSRNVS